MKIGSKYLPALVERRHWDSMWEDAGFSGSQTRARTIGLIENVSLVITELDLQHPARAAIADLVRRRCDSALKILT